MWHEARKQEKKIRGLMVDMRRRAERRREFYQKIKRDPNQFLRLTGLTYKVHLDPSIALAADSPQSMMPWQGNRDNMIDRFDVRANLDLIPVYKPSSHTKLTEIELEEQRNCNYERYRTLVQNECAGLSEEQCLHQIFIDEQFGDITKNDREAKKKKELEGKRAAIAYTYDDGGSDTATAGGSHSKHVKEQESDNSEDEDVDQDLDVAFDVDDLTDQQRVVLNSCATQYGMAQDDFIALLKKDKDDAEDVRMARLLEEEKAQYAGRKSRRERRAYKEKILAGRGISPPVYAARESPTYDHYGRLSKSSSRSPSHSPSPSDNSTTKMMFISSFGDGSDDEPQMMIGPALPKDTHTHTHVVDVTLPSRSERDDDGHVIHQDPSRSRKRSSSSESSHSDTRRRRSSSNSSSRSRSRSRRRSSSSSSSYSSGSSSRSRSRSPRTSLPAPPIKRYRRPSLDSDGSLHSDPDDRDSSKSSNSSSKQGTGGISNKVASNTQKMTPRERMKRRMQAALNKTYKKDKMVEAIKKDKQIQDEIDRDEDLRMRTLEMRRKEREKQEHGRDDGHHSVGRKLSRSRSRSPSRSRRSSRSRSHSRKSRSSSRDRGRDRKPHRSRSRSRHRHSYR